MKVYIAIIEDRHADVEVQPFASKNAAIAFARTEAEKGARLEADFIEQELTDAMVRDRWLYYATYSVEGDCVTVVEKELQ